jgi:hypothetical protein
MPVACGTTVVDGFNDDMAAARRAHRLPVGDHALLASPLRVVQWHLPRRVFGIGQGTSVMSLRMSKVLTRLVLTVTLRIQSFSRCSMAGCPCTDVGNPSAWPDHFGGEFKRRGHADR